MSRVCLDLSLTDDEHKEDCNKCALDTSIMRQDIYYNQEESLVRDEHKKDGNSGTGMTWKHGDMNYRAGVFCLCILMINW